MANMYGSSNVHSPTPSSSSASLPLESEDLSIFLQQFLHPSSASSSFIPHSGQLASSVPLGLRNERDGVVSLGPSTYVASSSEINFAEAGVKFDDWSRNGVGFGFGDQVDEIEFTFDTENDGGSASELGYNPAKSRSSSKRSRAAAVHNLSEKRRRSRINEKLKALQKLIPNSNKSDKASMLDEAIEYLKQLQLQVQMLSMKNGVNLHLSNEGTSYGMGKDMLPITSLFGTFPSDQDASNQPSAEISNHGNSSNLPKPALNNIPNSEIAFGLDQTLVAHYSSFNFSSQSKSEGARLLDAKKR